MQSCSNADAPAGPQEHFPDLAVARPALSERLRAEGSRSRALLLPRRAQEEHLNGATRGLASPQARRNDPRVVHDHDVGRLQVFGEIAKDAVLQPAGGSIDHEESRRITRLGRMLGDQVWGQRVIEVGEFHTGDYGTREWGLGTGNYNAARPVSSPVPSPKSPVPPFSLLGLDVDPRVVIPEDFLIGPSRARHPTRAPLAQTDAVTGPAAEELHDRLLVWGEPHDEEQPVVEFLGRGSGHGVGLSQWGARGMAGAGRTYQEILRYYYTGIDVETK